MGIITMTQNSTALKVPGRSLSRVLVEPNRLTFLIGREGVCSGWYGRSILNLSNC